MERGKGQVPRRSRRGNGPGRGEAEQPTEGQGRSGRSDTKRWTMQSTNPFNRLERFWHRCRGPSEGGAPGHPGSPVPGVRARAKGRGQGTRARTRC